MKGPQAIIIVEIYTASFYPPHNNLPGGWYYYPHFTEEGINLDSDSKAADVTAELHSFATVMGGHFLRSSTTKLAICPKTVYLPFEA